MKTYLVLVALMLLNVETDAQKMRTTQPTNYLREGPASYFQIVAAIPASVDVNKVDQKGSWLKVKTEQNDMGWLSENCFVIKSGTNTRDENIIKGKASTRASRAELAAAVKGFGKKYVDGSEGKGADISKYSAPIVKADDMVEFEHSFTVEPFRGYMNIEKPFDLAFHEEAIGLGIAQKIAAQKGIVDDRMATLYINMIGNYLSKYTKAYDLGFRFYIINERRAGAFAIPGGYIFITKGMFQACANEAELASVLAHEMVHVVQRHGIKELKKSEASIKAESAFGELEEETGPIGEDEQELEDYAHNVYQNLISPRLLAYETDADELALAYLYRAGYDPTALTSVLQKIYEPATTAVDIFDDNYMRKDDMRERIVAAQKQVREEGYRSQSKKQYTDRFLKYTTGVR
ncbi:MAG: M48 family metalloprotease [Bacteroidota bacterium]